MRYNKLGRTGLLVSELCLGTMTFGEGSGMWSAVASVAQQGAEEIVKASLDAGINFLDTADVYSLGRSEEITGQALKSLGIARSDVVIATKVCGQMGPGPNAAGASRGHILDSVYQSLKRLQTDHIDLYQIHAFDPVTPIEETLRALDDLVRQGAIRYFGLSNWAAWQVMKALGISERLGIARPESVQAYYTLAGRDLERELVPMMRSEQVGLMVWSPLAGGFLSGKYSREGEAEEGGRRTGFDFPPVDKDRAFDVIDAMRPIAEAHSTSVAQIAIAWLLHQPVVTSVIIGANKMSQLNDNIAAAEIALSADELAKLDQISRLPAEYPAWMLERQSATRGAWLNPPPRGRK